jgi:ADP-dependent NAD(P)H-hydrate dehydratase
MSTMHDITPAVLRLHPLPKVEARTDKDARGRVFIVAGSTFSPGAALLAGEAALRGGAGKASVGTTHSIALSLGMHAPELGIYALAATSDGEPDAADPGIDCGSEQCDAVLLGPGLMNENNAQRIARRLIEVLRVPIILDSAAITAFAKDFGSIKAGRQPRVLTPHAGEMAKLLGIGKDAVEESPRQVAEDAARDLDCFMVLKGAVTYIATPQGDTFKFIGGVAGLATAGSGDTLAGLMTALLARGATPLSACLWSVFVHAKSGATLSRKVGPLGFLARELPGQFPGLLQSLGAFQKKPFRDAVR